MDVSDLGTVHFLTMIPIYKDEREWIMENGTFEYLELLFEEFGEDALYADNPRPHFIPDEDQTEDVFKKNAMKILDIDEETYNKLQDFIEFCEANEIAISYKMIGEWLDENRLK